MGTFSKYLEQEGKSKSTVARYNALVLDFIAYLDQSCPEALEGTEIEHCTAKEVLSYLNHLQKPTTAGGRGQENKTRAIHLNVIKQFFYWQIKQEIRVDNPIAHLKIRGVKAQKLYPILSPQELEKIHSSYQLPQANDPRAKRNWFTTYKLSKERNKVILSLLINQGLTTAEINRLSVTDLKLREGEIYIQGSRKSNERTLKLKSNQIMDLMEYSLQLRPLLLNYQTDQQAKNLFLSTPTLGQQKTEKETLSVWKALTKEIIEQQKKMPEGATRFINFKQVRASVITKWLKQYNLREVQYMAGHRYISSTEKYLINNTEDLQTAIDKFHPIS